jgi:hypothetical protein
VHIINFAIKTPESLKRFEEEIHPSEYRIGKDNNNYKVIAVFLNKDMNKRQLNVKLSKLTEILKDDGLYSEPEISEVIKDFFVCNGSKGECPKKTLSENQELLAQILNSLPREYL